MSATAIIDGQVNFFAGAIAAGTAAALTKDHSVVSLAQAGCPVKRRARFVRFGIMRPDARSRSRDPVLSCCGGDVVHGVAGSIAREGARARCYPHTKPSAVASSRADSESRWSALMKSAQDGDTRAYDTLLRELLPFLRRVVARRWRNAADVEDIVQEILISLHGVRHTYDPARHFTPWLMTIAHRRIADAARRATHRRAGETTVDVMPETAAGPEGTAEQDAVETSDAFRSAMSQLPSTQRQAIELTKVEGLSLMEASRRSGRSVAALKTAVHRAIKALRRARE